MIRQFAERQPRDWPECVEDSAPPMPFDGYIETDGHVTSIQSARRYWTLRIGWGGQGLVESDAQLSS